MLSFTRFCRRPAGAAVPAAGSLTRAANLRVWSVSSGCVTSGKFCFKPSNGAAAPFQQRASSNAAASQGGKTDGSQVVQIDSFKDITAAAKRFVLRVHPDIMHAHGADAVATNEAALQEVFIMLDVLRGRSEAPDGPVAGFGASIVQAQYNLNYFVKSDSGTPKSTTAATGEAPPALRRVAVTLQTPPGLVERMALLAARGMKEKAGAAFIELARRSVQTLLDSAGVPMKLALSPRLAPFVSKRTLGEGGSGEADDANDRAASADGNEDSGFGSAGGDGPLPGEDPADAADRLARAAARKALAREAALMADAPSMMDAHLRSMSPLAQGKRESAAELAAAGYSWADFQPKRSRNGKRRAATAPPAAGKEADDADAGGARRRSAGYGSSTSGSGSDNADDESADSDADADADATAGLFGDAEHLLKQALGGEREQHASSSKRRGKRQPRMSASDRALHQRIADAEALGLGRLADRLRAEAAAQASTSSVFSQKQRRERALRILARLDSVLEANDESASAFAGSASASGRRTSGPIAASGGQAQSALGGVAVAEAVNRLITSLTDHHDVLQLYEDAWLTAHFAFGPPGSSFYADGPGRTLHLPVDFAAPAFVAFARERFVPAMLTAAREHVRGAADKERTRMRAAERERNKAQAQGAAAAAASAAGAGRSGFGLNYRAGGGFGAPATGMPAGEGVASHRTPAANAAAEDAAASLDELLLRSWAASGSNLR